MKAAFDEIMATAVKRQHEPQRIVGDLLNAEINEKQAARSSTSSPSPNCACQDLGLPFEGTPSPTLVNVCAGGGFIAAARQAVLVGGTGTGKTHMAIAIARSCIRSGARGRSTTCRPRNRLEIRDPHGRQGRIAEHLTRMTSSSSTRSATCRSPNPAASCCHLAAGSTRHVIVVTTNRFVNGPRVGGRKMMTTRAARPPDSPLRHR